MITALPLMPQVGLFSTIKWARFRLTKTFERSHKEKTAQASQKKTLIQVGA
jgi:hypothetical protein